MESEDHSVVIVQDSSRFPFGVTCSHERFGDEHSTNDYRVTDFIYCTSWV